MKNHRVWITIGGILIAASALLAQVTPKASPFPPEAPPAPPAPAAKPAPAPHPAPFAEGLFDDQTGWQDQQQKVMDKAAEALEKAQEKIQDKAWQDAEWRAADAVQQAQDKMLGMQDRMSDLISDKQWTALDKLTQPGVGGGFGYGIGGGIGGGIGYGTPLADLTMNMKLNFPLAQARLIGGQYGPRGSDDAIYRNGQNALDSHHYDQALESFNTVVSRGGARVEGALYWKAYALNKLGRRDEAQSAIDQLRKSYPGSRWLDESKALEVEIKASSGKPVSPEAETDEDIKILALNGLMQSDPERALPQVENLLKQSHSPKLKKQLVVVLGLNSSPRAKQDLEQIARTGNPDLQVAAIQYLSGRRGDTSHAQLFSEIYAASSDKVVKSAILDSFRNSTDKDRLVQIVKTEKDQDLRNRAIEALGSVDGQPELWQIYPGETTPEGKIKILEVMAQNGNPDKLAEVARTDKDSKVRLAAIRVIASQKGGNSGATLVAIYGAEQDPQVKRQIVGQLAGARNGKALVDIARAEKDTQLKLQIVEQLSRMTKYSKEANDYLQEILSK